MVKICIWLMLGSLSLVLRTTAQEEVKAFKLVVTQKARLVAYGSEKLQDISNKLQKKNNLKLIGVRNPETKSVTFLFSQSNKSLSELLPLEPEEPQKRKYILVDDTQEANFPIIYCDEFFVEVEGVCLCEGSMLLSQVREQLIKMYNIIPYFVQIPQKTRKLSIQPGADYMDLSRSLSSLQFPTYDPEVHGNKVAYHLRKKTAMDKAKETAMDKAKETAIYNLRYFVVALLLCCIGIVVVYVRKTFFVEKKKQKKKLRLRRSRKVNIGHL